MATKTVSHTGQHGTIHITVEPKAHTSDGEERPNNALPFAAVTLAAVPYSIDDGSRVGALALLANNLNLILTNKSKANITGIAQNASYDQNSVTSRINDLVNGINSVTANTLKPYLSVDYNSFTSVVQQLSAAMNTINT